MQFQSARRKLERAKEHIAEVEKTISRVASPNAQTVWVDDSNAKVNGIHYRLERFGELRDIAPVLGDAIHNLRAVLDHAWFETLQNIAPDLISSHTKFPVYETPDSLKSCLAGIKLDVRVPRLFKAIVSDIKPYEPNHGGHWFIKHLHDLDILDKHKLLFPTVSKVWPVGLTVEHKRVKYPVSSHAEERGGEFTVYVPSHLKIEENGSIAIEVVLHEGSLKVEEIRAMLGRFDKTVCEVMKFLESFVEPSK
jgi:hypothetical protein